MSQELHAFYERELAFISSERDPLARYFAKHFPAEAGFSSVYARRYPAKAGQLEQETKLVADPHAERLIQGFALLAGRIHHKIQQEIPQLTEALLGILYPHLLRPVPSMTIARFAATRLKEHLHIAQHSPLVSRPVGHPATVCQWRTGYPVDLWPIEVVGADVQSYAFFPDLTLPKETAAVLRLRLECQEETTFARLGIDKLRFFLNADRETTATLYEMLFNNTLRVLFRDAETGRVVQSLSADDCLFPVGFELDEGLLPFPCESFLGYRLFTEFFAFPNKYWFVDLGALDRADAGKQLEVLLLLDRFDEVVARAVDRPTFQLGCTPLVNLFSMLAEPINLDQLHHEYKVIPGRGFAKNGLEIYSLDSLTTFDPNEGILKEFQPFFAFTSEQHRDTHKAFWFASRRDAVPDDVRTQDMFVVLVDGDFNPHVPAEESVNIHTTCSNGELPAQFLRVGDALVLVNEEDFDGTIFLLHAPTSPRRPILREGTFWRWLSQTVLGHAPFSEALEGIDALKETLMLCAATRPATGSKQQEAITRQLISGVTAFHNRRVLRSMHIGEGVGTCRGVEFTVELDRQKYVGTGAYLFASVLDRFLGMYAAVNSFSQLRVQTTQGKGYLKQWPPRTADRQLM